MISMVFAGIAVDTLGVPIVYKILAGLVLLAGALVTFSKYMTEINTADFEA
jgi:hypothetical protein